MAHDGVLRSYRAGICGMCVAFLAFLARATDSGTEVLILSPPPGFVVDNEFLSVEFGVAHPDAAAWRYCVAVNGVTAVCGALSSSFFLRMSAAQCEHGTVCAGPREVELGVSAFSPSNDHPDAAGGAVLAVSHPLMVLVPCQSRQAACNQSWCRSLTPPRGVSLRHITVAMACDGPVATGGGARWPGAVFVERGVHVVRPREEAGSSSSVGTNHERLAAYAAGAVPFVAILPRVFGGALCDAARDLGTDEASVAQHCGGDILRRRHHVRDAHQSGARVVHMLVQPGEDAAGNPYSSVLCRESRGHGDAAAAASSCLYANLYYYRGRWIFYADGHNVLDSTAFGWQCVDRPAGQAALLSDCPAPAVRLGSRGGAPLMHLWLTGDGLRHVFRTMGTLGGCPHAASAVDGRCDVRVMREPHVLLSRHEPETFGHAVMDGVVPAVQLLNTFGVDGPFTPVFADRLGPSPHDGVFAAVAGAQPVVDGDALCGDALCVFEAVAAGIGGLGEAAETPEKAAAIADVHARLGENLGLMGACQWSAAAGGDARTCGDGALLDTATCQCEDGDAAAADADAAASAWPCSAGAATVVQRRRSRRIANAGAIAELITSSFGVGASVIEFEEHPFSEQVRLLSRSGIVISVWGSGIDNIAISAPAGAALLAVPVVQPMQQLGLLRTLARSRPVYLVESTDPCFESGPGCNVSLAAVRSAIEHALDGCGGRRRVSTPSTPMP